MSSLKKNGKLLSGTSSRLVIMMTFILTVEMMSPGLYYFHLCLLESGDPCRESQVSNKLPSGYLLQTIADESSTENLVKEKKKRVSPTEEYRKGLLETRKEMTGFFAAIGQEKKRENDLKEQESTEKKNSKVRKLEEERSMQSQF